MRQFTPYAVWCSTLLIVFAVQTSLGQEASTSPIETTALSNADVQQDYPDMCLDRDGTPWVVYIAYDGKADQLMLAQHTDAELRVIGSLSSRGLVQQPRITCDGKGALWAVWSQLDENEVWNLHARQVIDGEIQTKTISVADSRGNDIFCDAATDTRGRVWVAWQSLRGATGDIFARYYDSITDRWSQEIQVTSTAGGEWEPRLAFAADDEAAVIFDSSDGDSFDVVLATVQLDGTTKLLPVAKSPNYEARASIAASADRKGFWIAWERGLDRWGGDRRGHAVNTGLNARKQIDVVYFDVTTKRIKPTPNVKPLLSKLAGVAAAPKNPARQAANISVNLPQLFVARDGTVYLMCRYARNNGVWHIALTRYESKKNRWTSPLSLQMSSFNQDRYCCGHDDGNGNIWLAWPADLRTTKKPGVAGVYLGRMDASLEMQQSETEDAIVQVATTPRNDPARQTPQRSRDERFVWNLDGRDYGLYWGDFHRHTSFSNCRTITDGCIVEQFRYAFDAGKLDFLGTSDHTDIAKAYSPYEWWENQKLHDLFQVPGFFNTFYVYEREQRWPWGHRNVIFAKRGAPIIYIKRATYQKSPWAKNLPVADGPAEISPQELWKLLKASGYRACVISHTGATGMGTNWDLYEEIDYAVETLVEIYQGARVSYEGIDAPQPTVGLRFGDKFNQGAHDPANQRTSFGKYSKGVYQNALANGHQLGVFANSDHISTNTTFGGVYAEEFTREGIMDAIDARRSIAATDKIFLHYTCNDKPLGSIFETKVAPELSIRVAGTSAIASVTIVRNEKDYKTLVPDSQAKVFETSFTDPAPIAGENRYYIRVIQKDGNMAWASPVWVTYEK